MKNITPLGSIIASLILFAGVPLLYAWTGPSMSPPSGNVTAPVNVGSTSQNKAGVLGLGGLAVFGKSLFTLTSGYSLPTSNSNMILGVNGFMGAKGYCDENGNNCVTTLGGQPAAAASGGGSTIVCGGWDVKYGSSNPINGWGCGAAASCPSGYDVIKSSKVTINMAEQTNLCVLHSAGSSGGGSSGQMLSGWPNKIICNAPNGTGILDLSGWDKTLVSYSDKQDRGMWIQFNINTKKYANGAYGDLAGYSPACFGKDITNSMWQWVN